MIETIVKRSAVRARALVAAFAAFMLAATLCCENAYADVRKADVISGQTVEARGLSVASCPSISCECAVLVDADGNVLFERNGSKASQIASITKVMTAIVAIDKAQEGTHVAVSEAAATIGESSANLMQGDVMDLETALKALLVPSGNDAALAIAETVGAQMVASDPSLGNDPMQAFVDAMNAKASELGCEDTLYENPHGLDDGEHAGNLHSTALDQGKVAKCAMSYDLIRDIVAGGSTTVTVERNGKKEKVDLETTDELLEMYDRAIGVKTGVTNLAGPSFMGAANNEGRELYAVVLGAADEHERFVDAKKLFEWAYEHVVEVKLAQSSLECDMQQGTESVTVPVVAEVSHGDWVDKTVKATLSDPEAAVSVFDFEGNVSQSVTCDTIAGDVHAGDKVGTVVFKQRNMVVAEQDLVACENTPAPNAFEALGIWWQRFIGGFDGSPVQADTKIYNVMPIINDNKAGSAA